MCALLFKCNDQIIGVFDDKIKFKTSTFHYIINTFLAAGMFKTKKECGMSVKEELKKMYSEENFTFSRRDYKFDKISLQMNRIAISIPRQYSSDTRFLFYRENELNISIPLLSVTELINCDKK